MNGPDFDPSAFGIRPEDEGVHPHDPEDEGWQESIFYDWCSSDGSVAGHVRIGHMHGRGRIWAWCFVSHDGEWVAFEDPHIAPEAIRGLDVETPAFSFQREITAPLVSNGVRARGEGRFVSGPRAGEAASFSVDLRFEALGPCHSIGDQGMAGHTSDELSASRFEQPMRVTGSSEIAGARREVDGYGERDHSWGPRDWNIEWTFLALSGPERQSMAVRVSFDEDTYFDTGYLAAGEMRTVVEADFELDVQPERVAGRVEIVDEAGRTLAGVIEPLSQAPIDASHAFSPPRESDYRRTLLRFTPDDEGAAQFGFLETNRFPDGFPPPRDD